jgi:hypothetical protein
MTTSKASVWTPPPRPEWLQRFNDEARGMDINSLVPLDPTEMIETAKRNTGFDDFGADDWREPYAVFVKALNEEAGLHPFGRLLARQDVLIWLEALLGVQAAFNQHPEIDDEIIDAPVIIAGLPRSGTSILFEILSQDAQFGSPRQWEMMFPYPPPERATYETDPRIEKCQHLVTQWNRVTPTYATMHEMDARLPNECILAQACTFVSEMQPGLYQVPSYLNWVINNANWEYPYRFYKRMLKLWQWKNPRKHWLLKAPSHLNYLPVLFKVFPDARLVMTHRDPIKAQASVISLMGTIYWQRSDKPIEVEAFESLFEPAATSAKLGRIIDWIETGTIPRERVFSLQYQDLIKQPIATVGEFYRQAGLEYSAETERHIKNYLAQKPQGKFGKHNYSAGELEEIQRKREFFRHYQQYFGVADEN